MVGDPFERRGSTQGAGAEVAGLLEDVADMAHAAAEDGLPMEALLSDLRLLCDVGPDAPLPLDVLRVATLAWSDHQSTLAAGARSRRGFLVEADELGWSLLTRAEGAHHVWVLEVDVVPDDPPPPVGVVTLATVVEVVRSVFGEQAALVAAPTDHHLLVLPDADPHDVHAGVDRARRVIAALADPTPLLSSRLVDLGPSPAAAADALGQLVADLVAAGPT